MSPGRPDLTGRGATVTAIDTPSTGTLPSWSWVAKNEVAVSSTFGSGKTSALGLLDRILADAWVSQGRSQQFDLRFLNSVVEVKSHDPRRARRARLTAAEAVTLPAYHSGDAVKERLAPDADSEARLLVHVWNSYRDAQRASEGGRLTAARPQAPQFRLDVATRWEGVVLDVLEDSFLARLTDESGQQPDVDAEIFLSEVSPGDRDLLRKRAVFYWVMGYRDTRDGDRIRESRLRFRRLPGWRPEDLVEAERWAERVRAELGWG